MTPYAIQILQLFTTFFLIGMFTFGGGYAVMSLIQSEIVEKMGWISEGTFTDIAAIAQMTPGPVGLNCSTYVGYEVAGIAGSVAASTAVVLPSFIIMFLIVKFYMKFHENRTFAEVMDAIKPAVAGMIGAAALGLMFRIKGSSLEIVRENFTGWKSWLIFAAAFASSLFLKLGPIKIICAAALIGLILYL